MSVFDWLRGRRTGAPTGPPGLDGWRRAWAEAAARGACTDVDQLRARLEAAGLPEDDIEVEREMLDGLVALCALRNAAERDGLPVLETGHRAAAGAPCHFSAPASMPDEPGQPSGRLLLTGQRAVFAGAGGAGVSWHAVAQALQAERDIILVHRGRDRPHRFRCNSYADALTGAYIARHLLTR